MFFWCFPHSLYLIGNQIFFTHSFKSVVCIGMPAKGAVDYNLYNVCLVYDFKWSCPRKDILVRRHKVFGFGKVESEIFCFPIVSLHVVFISELK